MAIEVMDKVVVSGKMGSRKNMIDEAIWAAVGCLPREEAKIVEARYGEEVENLKAARHKAAGLAGNPSPALVPNDERNEIMLRVYEEFKGASITQKWPEPEFSLDEIHAGQALVDR